MEDRFGAFVKTSWHQLKNPMDTNNTSPWTLSRSLGYPSVTVLGSTRRRSNVLVVGDSFCRFSNCIAILVQNCPRISDVPMLLLLTIIGLLKLLN